MVAKIDSISEASHKHAGEVTALAFDGAHLYSGGTDGVLNVWDRELKFGREIAIHKEMPVISLVVNSHKQLYSSGRDGSLRYFRRPWSHDNNDILLQTVQDDVTCLYIADDVLYSADDKGIVTKWYHNQVGAQYNVLEEVKSMAIEEDTLYTVRETDVVVTDVTPRQTQKTKASFPGRFPLILIGTIAPVIPDSVPQGRRASYVPEVVKNKKYIVSATRDGKGFVVANNSAPYKVVATKEDAHSMLINVMCDDKDFLFTAGFDGKVKKWKDLENPTLVEEIDTGKCINAMVAGSDHTIYVGDVEGFIKRLQFGTE